MLSVALFDKLKLKLELKTIRTRVEKNAMKESSTAATSKCQEAVKIGGEAVVVALDTGAQCSSLSDAQNKESLTELAASVIGVRVNKSLSVKIFQKRSAVAIETLDFRRGTRVECMRCDFCSRFQIGCRLFLTRAPSDLFN